MNAKMQAAGSGRDPVERLGAAAVPVVLALALGFLVVSAILQ